MKTTSQITSNLFLAALCAVASLSPLPAHTDKPASAKQSQTSVVIIRAQGHPKHMDFVARSSKRADLRANVQRIGLDAAFTEWLRAEHSHVYREHLSQLARQQQNTTTDKVAVK